VTEFGIAQLYGKTLRQRVRELMEVAHPDFRAALEQEAWERNILPRPQVVPGQRSIVSGRSGQDNNPAPVPSRAQVGKPTREKQV
jgi:acyl-CoA hydrolase